MSERKLNIYELQTAREYWKKVNDICLSEEDRTTFQLRKKAVDMYIDGYSLKEIHACTKIHVSRIYILVEKCATIDESTNHPFGYAALIPHVRVKKYKRTRAEAEVKTNYSGTFEQFLRNYPALQKFIFNQYFGKNNETLEKNISVKTLHCKFIEKCRELKIQDYEYPLNTKDRAERSFYRYIRKLVKEHTNAAMNRESVDAKQRFFSTGIGNRHRPYPITPFSVVQLDGHKIDTLYTVDVENKHGEIIKMPAMRLWLICVIDVSTRTILGYSLSGNENYNQTDVLKALRNAMIPKQKITFTLRGLSYPENGGYPSLAIPETEWAMLDSIMLDNAKAHLAQNVIEKLSNQLMCSVNFGPIATPETRGVVERVFETLEENGFHRLPSTTGSNINDNRRRNAEKDAVKYQITYNDIMQMTEYLIAIYNNSAHSSLDNQTPLECMERRIRDAGMLPSIATVEEKSLIASLTYMHEIKTVRGSNKTGKRPYITYKGVEYRSDLLGYSMGLIGQKIMIEINPDDIRTIKAYFINGAELGLLMASGEWGRKSHSLKTRELGMKRANENKQKNNRFYAPLTELEKELKERATTERRARTKASIVKAEQTNDGISDNPKAITENEKPPEVREKQAYTAEEIQALLEADSVEDAYYKGLI